MEVVEIAANAELRLEESVTRITNFLKIAVPIIDDIKAITNTYAENSAVSPKQAATAYFSIKQLYDDLDKMTKELYHSKDKFDKAIVPSKLEAAGMDLIRVPEIARSFSINKRTSASVLDKDALFKWLREQGQGDIIVETVNAGTLASLVRNMQLEQGIEPPDDIVKVSNYNTTSVNKYVPKDK